MRRLSKYKKWKYDPGDRVVWAGLSATVISQQNDTVRIQIHKQKSTDAYIANAYHGDVSLPYPTRTESGWVWPEVEDPEDPTKKIKD